YRQPSDERERGTGGLCLRTGGLQRGVRPVLRGGETASCSVPPGLCAEKGLWLHPERNCPSHEYQPEHGGKPHRPGHQEVHAIHAATRRTVWSASPAGGAEKGLTVGAESRECQ